MNTKVMYVCDGKACDNCSYPSCNYTSNIEHAKNFRRVLTTHTDVYYREDIIQVSMIRCKDCKWWKRVGCFCKNEDLPSANDFCSHAERKEENDER